MLDEAAQLQMLTVGGATLLRLNAPVLKMLYVNSDENMLLSLNTHLVK